MRKVANTLLIITSVLIFTGILFKKMHWPGANIALIFGSLLSLFGMLFYFIARYKNKHNVKVATYSVYFYFFVMVVGTGYYSAIGASRDLLDGFHDVNVRIEKSNESLIGLISNRNSEGMKLYDTIEKHKLALICDDNPYASQMSKNEILENYCSFNGAPLNKGNQDIAGQYFVWSEHGIELEQNLKRLRKSYVSALGENHPHLIENVEYINFSSYDPSGPEIPWISALCEHLPLIAVLPKLSSIQNQILHCELAMQK